MREYTIGTHTYRVGKMDVFTQLHIARRLTPCVAKLGALAGSDAKPVYDKSGKIVDIDGDLEAVLTPLTNAVTAMTDEDVDFILNGCLEITERKQPGGAWAPLRKSGVTMFDGLTLPVLLQIAYHAVMENIADFFSDLPSLSVLEGFLKAKGLHG